MSLKHVLVHVDHSRGARVRFNLAAHMGAAFNAHLTGLYVRPEGNAQRVPSMAGVELTPEARQAIALRRDEILTQEKELLDLFADAARAAQASSEPIVEDGSAAELAEHLTAHGRAADVIVLGKPDVDDPDAIGRHVPHEVLFGSGVPVLVVPREVEVVGRHACVAWDGSREAARATRDAMPLLERCRSVNVLCVNQQRRYGNKEPGAELVRQLHIHGIEASLELRTAPSTPVGETILDSVVHNGADMLVMGAYGHSRLREFVLGGTTRRLLDHASVPLFMSH